MATVEQSEWVSRVLGIAVPGRAGTGTASARSLSLVRLGKARLGWYNDRLMAVAEIGRLRAALNTEFGADQEQAAALTAALGRLDRLVDQFDDMLDQRLDDVLNEGDESRRAALRRDAVAALDRFETLVGSDPILAELDGNEVLPDMKAIGPLRRRLSEISAALG